MGNSEIPNPSRTNEAAILTSFTKVDTLIGTVCLNYP